MKSQMDKKYKIAAVVVTYNRLTLFQECITALRNQSHKLDEIIIINNSSTDGTIDWLNSQTDLTVITQENSGSAGGQYTGIKTAYEKGYDWVWCMDDDSAPNFDSLMNLVEFILHYCGDTIGFLYPKVTWKDGQPHLMNLPGNFKKKRWNIINNHKNEVVQIDLASFVGILINLETIKTVGLPKKELFIWYDDLEYTVRFKNYNNYFVPNSLVFHNSERNSGVDLFNLDYPLNIKEKYGIRNFFYFYAHRNIHYAFIVFLKVVIKTILYHQEPFLWWRIRSFMKYSFRGITNDLRKIL